MPSSRSHGNLCCSRMGLVRVLSAAVNPVRVIVIACVTSSRRVRLCGVLRKQKNQLSVFASSILLSRCPPATNEFFDSPRTYEKRSEKKPTANFTRRGRPAPHLFSSTLPRRCQQKGEQTNCRLLSTCWVLLSPTSHVCVSTR